MIMIVARHIPLEASPVQRIVVPNIVVGNSAQSLCSTARRSMCVKPAVDECVGDTRTVFCEKWECIDYANTAGKYNYLEYETHTCSKRNADFAYCEDWDWQTDDYDSFENTACECVDVMTTGAATTCRQFECLEKGAEKISPNLLWSILGGVFSLELIRMLYFPLFFSIDNLCFGVIYLIVLIVVGIVDITTARKFKLT